MAGSSQLITIPSPFYFYNSIMFLPVQLYEYVWFQHVHRRPQAGGTQKKDPNWQKNPKKPKKPKKGIEGMTSSASERHRALIGGCAAGGPAAHVKRWLSLSSCLQLSPMSPLAKGRSLRRLTTDTPPANCPAQRETIIIKAQAIGG